MLILLFLLKLLSTWVKMNLRKWNNCLKVGKRKAASIKQLVAILQKAMAQYSKSATYASENGLSVQRIKWVCYL